MSNFLLPPAANRSAGNGRRESVVTYGWVSPTVTLSADGQAERIHRRCETEGWQVASELWSRRFPELIELARRATESGVGRVLLAREALQDLERRFPEVWGDVRARLEARGVRIEVC